MLALLSASGGDPAIDIPAIAEPDPVLFDVSAHYPRQSVERHEEGLATVTYVVNAMGSAEQCVVEVSAGYPALDAASCELIGSAIFLPEADSANGAPRVRRLQRINWRLPR